jgi:hypothetical protein
MSCSENGRINHIIILEEKEVKEDLEEIILDARGVVIILVRDLIFMVTITKIMDMRKIHVESLVIRSNTINIRKKKRAKYQIFGKR